MITFPDTHRGNQGRTRAPVGYTATVTAISRPELERMAPHPPSSVRRPVLQLSLVSYPRLWHPPVVATWGPVRYKRTGENGFRGHRSSVHRPPDRGSYAERYRRARRAATRPASVSCERAVTPTGVTRPNARDATDGSSGGRRTTDGPSDRRLLLECRGGARSPSHTDIATAPSRYRGEVVTGRSTESAPVYRVSRPTRDGLGVRFPKSTTRKVNALRTPVPSMNP